MRRGLVVLMLCSLLSWGIPAVLAREGQIAQLSLVPSSEHLVVMTYNIRSGRGMDGLLDLDRIHDVIEQSGAQLVALQEVERWTLRSAFKDQLGQLAERAAWQRAFGLNLTLPPGLYGNALLSAHPILESTNRSLPSPREARGLLRSVIEVGEGQRIAVYATHLGLNQGEREQHVEILLSALETEELPFILMGDFNATPDSREIQRLQSLLQDAGAAVDQPTFPADGPTHRIDYLFVSQHFAIENVLVIDSLASDHRPVVAHLRLNR